MVLVVLIILSSWILIIKYHQYQRAITKVEGFFNMVNAAWKLMAEATNAIGPQVDQLGVRLDDLETRQGMQQTQVDLMDMIIGGYGELLHTKALTSKLSGD